MKFPFNLGPKPAGGLSREAFLLAALAAGGVTEASIAEAMTANNPKFLVEAIAGAAPQLPEALAEAMEGAGVVIGPIASAIATSDPVAIASAVAPLADSFVELTELRAALTGAGVKVADVRKDPTTLDTFIKTTAKRLAAEQMAARGLKPIPGASTPRDLPEVTGRRGVQAKIEAQLRANA